VTSFRRALLSLTLCAVAGCVPRPQIVTPADGSSLGLDGSTPVVIELGAAPGDAAIVKVSLLQGIDAPPATVLPVPALVQGSQATAQLDADDLRPGRNALFVAIDVEGDGRAENFMSSTFRWDPLRAAACARDITPVTGVNYDGPIFMAGFDNDRQATGVHDPIWARGFVLENAERKLAFVTLDVVGYFHNEVETLRADPALAGLGFDAVLVSSTHNHEGPDTMGLWGPDQTTDGTNDQYLDFVNQQVVQCVLDADAALAPAEMRFATGSTVGTSLPPNTDLVADGHVLQELSLPGNLFLGVYLPPQPDPYLVEGDPGPIINPSVPALQIRDRVSRETIATVVNYASHPESLGSDNTLLTSDFPHFMREALESLYGGTAIYVSADLGVLQGPLDVDVTDPDTGQPAARRTFRFAEVMGETLAERAAAALDAAPGWDPNPALDHRSSGPFQVRVENLFFQALAELGVFGRREPEDDPQGRLAIRTEANLVRIGPAQLVYTPNELDPQIGDQYRAMMTAAEHRWIVGLGNDEIGYQMPAEKFNPACFECSFFILAFDSLDGCPLYQALGEGEQGVDCSTVFINNIGPAADPLLSGEIEALLGELNP
jgi:hypothetical protein